MQKMYLTKFSIHLWGKKISLIKVGIEGTYLNIIRANYDKPTVNVTFNREKLKDSPLNSRMPTLTISI